MNVWGQLCARGLGYVISRFRHTEADTHEITKTVKMIITKKAILGHSLMEIPTYLPTEDILAPTRVLTPAASTTTLSNQGIFDGLEGLEPTAPFEWSAFGFYLCLVCLLALLGLCIGFLPFLTVHSSTRFTPGHHLLLPSSHGDGNDNHGNGGMLQHDVNSPRYHITLGIWLRGIREACDIAIVSTPGVLKSRWSIFISGMIICHLGKRAFDTVEKGDFEVFTGLMWAFWDVIIGLVRLVQQQEDVVHQCRLHSLTLTITTVLDELKNRWVITLLVLGMLSLTTAVVVKWRSMSRGARQDMWFMFLRGYRCLWTLLGTCWAFIFAKLINLGQWCYTQDIRGSMIKVFEFDAEIAKIKVKVLLFLAEGLYKIHHHVIESERQRIIGRHKVEHEAKDAQHDKVNAENQIQIFRQKVQIDTMNQQISGLTQERNKFRAKYEDAEERVRMTWLQSEKHKNAILYEAQLQVDAANHKYERVKGLCRIGRHTPHQRQTPQPSHGGDVAQRILNLESQLEEATKPCKGHISRITKLEGDNKDLRARLEAKDKIIGAASTEDHATKIAELERDIVAFRARVEEKDRIIDANSASCKQHTLKITRLENDNTAFQNELQARPRIINAQPTFPEWLNSPIDVQQIPKEVGDAVYQYLLDTGWQEVLDNNTKMRAGGLKLEKLCKEQEAKIEEIQSSSSMQHNDSKEIKDLQSRLDGCAEELKHFESTCEDRKKQITRLETEVRQVEGRLEHTQNALSTALAAKHGLTKELEELKKPVASTPPSEWAARTAFMATFPNGTKRQKFEGLKKELRCLVTSLQLQHNIADVTLSDLEQICDYPLNATQIAAARKEGPNRFDYDSHQLAKVLEFWSRQRFGKSAVLGVRTKEIKRDGYYYQILGSDVAEMVVWVERLVPTTEMQIPGISAFGLSPAGNTSGGGAATTS
ncbi:MAG: hypothetical protein Q9198_003585 [Flavoplaca austrocitrina]